MSAKYEYEIRIRFNGRARFKPIVGQMRISTAFDQFELGSNMLSISYARSKRQKPADAFNATRRERLCELWMLYFSCCGRMPKIKDVAFISNSELIDVELSLIGLPDVPKIQSSPIISSECAERICRSTYRNSLMVSLSFLIASKRKGLDEFDRFRFLWSSFNPLYNAFSRDRGEWARARNLIISLEEAGLLDKAKEMFIDAPSINSRAWRFGDYLAGAQQVAICQDEGNFRFRNEAAAKAVVSDIDLGTLEMLARRYQYKQFRAVPLESNYIEQKLSMGASLGGEEFSFVMRDYLYWLRCDTMHGNSAYPLFVTAEQQALQFTLNDCLEEAIVHAIDMISLLGGPDNA